jgi:hypothetical protein
LTILLKLLVSPFQRNETWWVLEETIKPDLIRQPRKHVMSIAFDPRPRSGALEDAFAWLREAKSALVRRSARVSALSDRDLADIGVRPRTLSSSVDREASKPRMVDFGWRLGR